MFWTIFGVILSLGLGFLAGCVAMFCAMAVVLVFKAWLFEGRITDLLDALVVGLLWLAVYGGLGWLSLQLLAASVWTIAGGLIPLLFCAHGVWRSRRDAQASGARRA